MATSGAAVNPLGEAGPCQPCQYLQSLPHFYVITKQSELFSSTRVFALGIFYVDSQSTTAMLLHGAYTEINSDEFARLQHIK